MNKQEGINTVLVTGVTGYVGGRLVPRLLESGYHVRVMVRGSTMRLDGRPWKDRVEIAIGDVLVPESLPGHGRRGCCLLSHPQHGRPR